MTSLGRYQIITVAKLPTATFAERWQADVETIIAMLKHYCASREIEIERIRVTGPIDPAQIEGGCSTRMVGGVVADFVHPVEMPEAAVALGE